MAISQLVSLGY